MMPTTPLPCERLTETLLPTEAENQAENQASLTHLLTACIQCGMCLSACPTYGVTGSEAESPRGRIHLVDLWQQERLTAEAIAPHLDQCLGCRSCETACPSGVQYGELLNTSRYLIKKESPSHWFAPIKRWLLATVLPSPVLLSLARLGALLYTTTGIAWVAKRTGLLALLPPSLQAMEQLCPPVAWNDAPSLQAGQRFGKENAPLVLMPVGCVMNTFMADIHHATIEVIVALGFQVLVPQLPCCGALAHHAGELSLSQQQALATLQAWKVLNTPTVPIVMNSAGCAAHYKELAHLFPSDSPLHAVAEAFSQQVVDVHEWLLPQCETLALKMKSSNADTPKIKAIYQPACHLYHAQGVQSQPIDVLSVLPAVEWVPLADASLCCGSAGIYNIEQPLLSQQVLDAKLDAIEATGAELLAVANPGCYLQLRKGLQQRGFSLEILHPMQVLARYLG
jgi:glycolate oxidase iron-sulfur subunit